MVRKAYLEPGEIGQCVQVDNDDNGRSFRARVVDWRKNSSGSNVPVLQAYNGESGFWSINVNTPGIQFGDPKSELVFVSIVRLKEGHEEASPITPEDYSCHSKGTVRVVSCPEWS